MPKKETEYPDLTMVDLKKDIEKVCSYLKVSMAEFEATLGMPKKTLATGLNIEGRRVADKHITKFLEFLAENDIMRLIHEEKEGVVTHAPKEAQNIFGNLSKEEVENKMFWYDEVKKAVAKHRGN